MINKENCHRISQFGKWLTSVFWVLSVISLLIEKTNRFWKWVRIQLLITVLAHVFQLIWIEKITGKQNLSSFEKWKVFFAGVFHSLYLRHCQEEEDQLE